MKKCFYWIIEPRRFQALNGWLVVFWTVMIPVSIALGWVSTIPYVSALSIYALLATHLSVWQASRTEVQQKEQQDDADMEKVERKVNDLHDQNCD